jgi:hypothetical protein
MSHQDDAYFRKNTAAFKAILESCVPESVASYVRHGNAQLEPSWLASVAVTCWGWTSEGTLNERVAKACKVVGFVFDRQETVTRQGLMKALGTCGPDLVKLMIQSLTSHVQSLKGYWTKGGKVNIAVDGSKFAAPRTAANQAYFAATAAKSPKKKKKKYKKAADKSKASTVQVLLTVFWHIQSGLPLQWMTSASNGSERRNAAKMLDDLPKNARLIGDAEYVGYPLWSKIHHSGRTFLVRVGSNMTFLENLGKYRLEDGFVYYWPDEVMRANDPPLVLRLIQIHDGKKAIFLVTNELDMDDDLACELYSERWNIETFFRTVKQTCERAKLHCQRPDNVLTELNWTLLGIWYALFEGKKVLLEGNVIPTDISPVKVIKAFSKVVDLISSVATPVSLLQDELANAVLNDESNRKSSKKSRNFPQKKKHRCCGIPTIRPANSDQCQRAKQLQI